MEPQKPEKTSDAPISLKGFTQTGSDKSAREVLKPQRDPAYMKKAITLSMVVFVAFFVLGYLVFLRSGKSLFGGGESSRLFEPPAHSVDGG